MDKVKTLFGYIIPITLYVASVVIGIYSLIYIPYKIVQSNGEIEYCYIESRQINDINVYTLYGSINWRADRQIKSSVDFRELIDLTKEIKCPMKLFFNS